MSSNHRIEFQPVFRMTHMNLPFPKTYCRTKQHTFCYHVNGCQLSSDREESDLSVFTSAEIPSVIRLLCHVDEQLFIEYRSVLKGCCTYGGVTYLYCTWDTGLCCSFPKNQFPAEPIVTLSPLNYWHRRKGSSTSARVNPISKRQETTTATTFCVSTSVRGGPR